MWAEIPYEGESVLVTLAKELNEESESLGELLRLTLLSLRSGLPHDNSGIQGANQ